MDGHGAGDATGHLDGDHAHDFTPKDLAALAVFVGSDGEVEPAVQLAAARSIGQATARLAEWEAEQIRALSSNSPTMRGATACFSSQRKSGARKALSSPGMSSGAPSRQAGNSPLRSLATAGMARKATPHSPRGWL